MPDFLTTPVPIPVWAMLLMTALLFGVSWAIREATTALSELFAIYRDLRASGASTEGPTDE